MKKYFLGVDGGNTKTDYVLFTIDGKYVDMLHTSTCSHEQFENGFDGMESTMRDQLDEILSRNDIKVKDIAAAGFGLAGADLPWQVKELKKRVEKIGFTKYGLANDGILGIKAESESGAGICAVNGTGTVVIGINGRGDILQIGGVGPLSGDTAGGSYIRDRIIATLYDFHYRCGEDSSMFNDVLELLHAEPHDLLSVMGDYDMLTMYMRDIIKLGAKAAMEGDKTAKKIFDDIGISIGKSAAGCINRLDFTGQGTADSPLTIVQVGSIWHKIPYEGMNASFLKTVQDLSGKQCRILPLETTAAVGGVLWAKEIADKEIPSATFRSRVVQGAK
ncbi:MAG: hypothetical protein FWF78_08795 [Defluviitaleaceae bacterium]|nr:hypothetical protein [Defluviitaleaceae bacterium]